MVHMRKQCQLHANLKKNDETFKYSLYAVNYVLFI